jgi:hypothetical protein
LVDNFCEMVYSRRFFFIVPRVGFPLVSRGVSTGLRMADSAAPNAAEAKAVSVPVSIMGADYSGWVR